jgi:inhibitor of cysteine peptidase
MREITEAHGGSEQHLTIGETFELRLGENPTTGYRWELESPGGPVLELVQDSFAPGEHAIGAGGERHWVFRAVQAGLARLELSQRRSWEARGVRSFAVTIRVGA